MTTTAKTRHTKNFPCPICDGYDEMPRGKDTRCFGFTSGDYANCTRSELAIGLVFNPTNSTYGHFLRGECRCGKSHTYAKQVPSTNGKARKPKSDYSDYQEVAAYDYLDESGKLMFQTVRQENHQGNKKIVARRPDGNGAWAYNLDGIEEPRPLYRQLELSRSREEITYVVEGENCADVLASHTTIAVTNPFGAGKWRHTHSEALRGRDVVILPDNDADGERHVNGILETLPSYAKSIKVVRLPGLPAKGDIVDWLDAGHTMDELTQIVEKTPTLDTGGLILDLVQLLDEIMAYVRRYVVLSHHQCVAVALWILHTHAIEAAETTPYLSIRSAEKRSGKSRLLEVVELLTPKPLKTENISAAALAHSIASGATLLLDEVDSIFKTNGNRSETQEMLRGILDGGFRITGKYVRMAGQGTNMTPKEFSTFGAKMLAGIGRLPGTLDDRSVILNMKRKSRSEHAERFRYRDAREQAEPLRIKMEEWAYTAIDQLRDARPQIPDALDDRRMDAWEPLLAIAEHAGADWPDSAFNAALALSTGEAKEDDSQGVRLLSDIRDVFGGRDKLPTNDLLKSLNSLDESPWGDWYGKPLDSRKMAKSLKPYGVRPKDIRTESGSKKGYTVADFQDAFSRYLDDSSETSATQVYDPTDSANLSATQMHLSRISNDSPLQ